MKRITLKPNTPPKRFGVAKGKWLIVREAEDYFYLMADTQDKIRVESGDKVFIGDLKEVEIYNPHVVDIDVLYQVSARDMSVQNTQLTKIAEAVDVGEIRSPVATRELVAQNFVTPEHITVPVVGKCRLVAASATRKEVIIQNISTTETEILVGDSFVALNRGLPVLGSRANVGGMVVSGGGEIWAYNNSPESATVAVLEVHE